MVTARADVPVNAPTNSRRGLLRGALLLLLLTGCGVPPEAEIDPFSGEPGSCQFRAVGFGRTDASGTLEGRKSASMCLVEVNPKTAWLVVAPQTGQTCAGDSGGPLVIRGTRKIVGVLSGGIGDVCDRDGTPSFYTSVEMTKDFIDKARAAIRKARTTPAK